MIDPSVSACYEGKKILFTGGSGYLASSVLQGLRHVDAEITRLDRGRVPFSPIEGIARMREVVADVQDQNVWKELIPETDIVFHFAAQTSARIANEQPLHDFSVNVLPLIRILDVCRSTGHNLVILLAGTVTEVGLTDRTPVNEGHPDRPLTVYDIHKLTAEKYLECFTDQGTIQGAVLRLANLYGPGPKSGSADRGILNAMILRALAGEPLSLYGQGQWIRDYLFIEDAAEAFILAGACIEKTNGHHYVLGSGEGHSLHDAFHLVADRVAAATSRRVEVLSVPVPEGTSPIEYRNFIADSTLFRTATGWLPRVGLEEGIDRTIAYYLGKGLPGESSGQS